MFIGKVAGNVVATQKTPAFGGTKLLLVEALTAEAGEKPSLKPTGRFVVVVDSVGAGEGEMVLVTQGSSARLTKMTGNMPVDAVAVGIIDAIHVGQTTVYKERS
jgi:ethanolamine utilization protein EutN